MAAVRWNRARVSTPYPYPDGFWHRPRSQTRRPKLALAGTSWSDAVLMLERCCRLFKLRGVFQVSRCKGEVSLRPDWAGSTTMRPWRHAGGERPDRGTGVVWPPALADDRPKSRRASPLGPLHPAWSWVSPVKGARAEASHVSSAEMLSGTGRSSFAIRA